MILWQSFLTDQKYDWVHELVRNFLWSVLLGFLLGNLPCIVYHFTNRSSSLRYENHFLFETISMAVLMLILNWRIIIKKSNWLNLIYELIFLLSSYFFLRTIGLQFWEVVFRTGYEMKYIGEFLEYLAVLQFYVFGIIVIVVIRIAIVVIRKLYQLYWYYYA